MVSENEAIRELQKRYNLNKGEAKETFISDLECKLFITGRKGFKDIQTYRDYLDKLEK